jgi:hypothetical protein
MANEIEGIRVNLPDPELLSLADKIVQVIEETLIIRTSHSGMSLKTGFALGCLSYG